MIRLLYNYYEDKNPIRKKEIDICLQNNLANPLLTTVVFNTPDKPSYNLFFEKINELTAPDDINIICNSDIFFDETIALTSKLGYAQCWALARWEWRPNAPAIHSCRPDSQDTWIVRGKINGVQGDFTLGKRGCDNRIAYEFERAGYKVSNPSKTIKTYHVHNSGIRYYSVRSEPVPPPYHTIYPTELI